MIIACDFDNTIMNPNNVDEGFKMGNPMTGAKEALKEFRRKGYEIIIHTHRGASPKHVEDWLRFYKIPFDQVTNIKPNADYFIDDKAIHFDNWENVMKEIK